MIRPLAILFEWSGSARIGKPVTTDDGKPACNEACQREQIESIRNDIITAVNGF